MTKVFRHIQQRVNVIIKALDKSRQASKQVKKMHNVRPVKIN